MSKMDTWKQRQIMRDEFQSMKDDWMKEMKIMMKEEIKIDKYTLKEAVHKWRVDENKEGDQ